MCPSVSPNKLCSLPHWPLLAAREAGKWNFLAGPKRVFVTKVNGRQDIMSLPQGTAESCAPQGEVHLFFQVV